MGILFFQRLIAECSDLNAYFGLRMDADNALFLPFAFFKQ